jgi:ribosomal protein S18 acetylase RimI-like enzyme
LRDGKVVGAALAAVEGRAADLAFLHMLPRFATVDTSSLMLDAVLGALPPGTLKVRAMGSHSGRWLHLVASQARSILLARGFAAFDRALMARELRVPVALPPAFPPGFTLDTPDPSQVEEHAQFAYRAYLGTTDFGVIALEETPQAYGRLYQRFLSGEFGAYARDLSRVVLAPSGAPAAVLHTIVLLGEPYVGDLSVVPEHRRKGLGRALLARGLTLYRDAGYGRAALTVTVQNTPALNLYRSVGFEIERSTELFLLTR